MNKQTKISAADCQLTISDIYTKYKTNLDIFIEKHYKINTNDKPIKLLFNYMVRYYKNEEHFEKMLEDQFVEVFNKINVKNPRKKDLEDYNFRLKLLSKNNRKSQETFCCEKCHHKNNADINAAKNIKGRFTNPKFKEEFQKEVADTQLISEPKILNRFKFKQKLFKITNN